MLGYFQGTGGFSFEAGVSGPGITGMVDLGTSGSPAITPDLVIGSLTGSGNVQLTTGNLITGTDNTNQSFSGTIFGIGGVLKVGSGTQTLNGANTFTGPVTITAGVLATNNVAAPGSAQGIGESGSLALNGGTFRYTGGASNNGFAPAISVGGADGTLDAAGPPGTQYIVYGGSFSGSGALAFLDSATAGTGTAAQTWLVTGDSTASGFNGPVTIGKSQTNSGWVQYRSNAANPFGTGTITINGGGILSADAGNTTPSTLGNNIILNGGELATQGVAMTYSGTITLNPSTNSTVGTVNGQSNTILLSGPVSGSVR